MLSRPCLCVALAMSLNFQSTGQAASWIENRTLSFDTTLDTNAGVLRDDQVFAKAWRQAPSIRSLGLPENAELSALAVSAGDSYFVADTSYILSGELVTPRDIVRRTDAGVSTIFLRGSELGLPQASRIVSLAFNGADVLFSLDTAATFGPVTAKAIDILSWNGATVSIAYAGSAMGIPDSTRITALERLASGRLLIAVDSHAQIGGISAGPGDLLEFDPGSGQWDMSRASARLGVTCQPCTITALAADGPVGAIFRSGLEADED